MIAGAVVGPIASMLARRRLAALHAAARDPGPVQRRLFERLLARMARTEFGRRHDLGLVRTPVDFAAALPLQDYASMAPWWERARHGERDVCWPGAIRYWALSSGTTSGEKFLPVSGDTIAGNKRGGFDSLVPHLCTPEGSRLFGGKLLFLGGCTQLRREGDVFVGDNTGIMALHVPAVLRRWHTPDRTVRALPSWEEKVARAAAQAALQDLRMLAGVPSWIVLFGEAVLAEARRRGRRADVLRDVWPALQLFVHGGVSFEPYRQRVRELVGADIRTTDTYSASEGGMLAVQDRDDDPGMLPLLDLNTFFEFVPRGELGSERPRRLTIAEVETGVDYAIALTTNSGIPAYLVGDLVRFTSRDPLRLVFAGRTAHTLSAFGEHVSGGELDRAIATAAAATGAVVAEYAVGVRFPDADDAMGQHCWFVEFHRAPDDAAAFAAAIDRTIQAGNEDYATHRSFGLRTPSVTVLPAGSFLAWMRRHGKIGGQHKVPRVASASMMRELREAAGGNG